MKENIDKNDRSAENYYRWQELSRELNLEKQKKGSYVPKCWRCKGMGRIVIEKINYTHEECKVCNGRGFIQDKSRKFLDPEIKAIVQSLGKDRVKELIQAYAKQRPQKPPLES